MLIATLETNANDTDHSNGHGNDSANDDDTAYDDDNDSWCEE